MYELVVFIILVILVIFNYSKIKKAFLPYIIENNKKEARRENVNAVKRQMEELEEIDKPLKPLSHIEKWNQILTDFINLPKEFLYKLGVYYRIF